MVKNQSQLIQQIKTVHPLSSILNANLYNNDTLLYKFTTNSLKAVEIS